MLPSLAKAQTVYPWINVLYHPEDMGEGGLHDLGVLMGHPRDVKTFSVLTDEGLIKENKGDSIVPQMAVEFEPNGMFTLEVFPGFEHLDLPITPEPGIAPEMNFLEGITATTTDDKGQIIFHERGIEKVHYRYDEDGRKVCDSVPGNGHTMAHNIRYEYFPSKVVAHTVVSGEDVESTVVYTLDKKGNWIRKVAVSSLGHRTIEKRTISYYR